MTPTLVYEFSYYALKGKKIDNTKDA